MQSSSVVLPPRRSRPLDPSRGQTPQQQTPRSVGRFPSATRPPNGGFSHPPRTPCMKNPNPSRSVAGGNPKSPLLTHHAMQAPRRPTSRWGDKKRPPFPPAFQGPSQQQHSSPAATSRWGEHQPAVNTAVSSTSHHCGGGDHQDMATHPWGTTASCSRSGIPFKKRKRFPEDEPKDPHPNQYDDCGLDDAMVQNGVSAEHPRVLARVICETPLEPCAAKQPALALDGNRLSVNTSVVTVSIEADEEDEASKAAIVSEGPATTTTTSSQADSSCLESSTASSHGTLLSPLGGDTTAEDIPKHIETPTNSNTDLAWDEKIPKKKSKTKTVPRSTERQANTATLGFATACAMVEDWEIPRKNSKIHRQQEQRQTPAAATTSESSCLVQEAVSTRVNLETRKEGSEAATNTAEPAVKKRDGVTSLAAADTASTQLSTSALRRKAKYLRVQVGARVSVFWDGENTYYDATVTRERPHKKKRFYLEYDDGDCEWINLRKEKWRLLGGGKSMDEISLPDGWNADPTVSESKSVTLKVDAHLLVDEKSSPQVTGQDTAVSNDKEKVSSALPEKPLGRKRENSEDRTDDTQEQKPLAEASAKASSEEEGNAVPGTEKLLREIVQTVPAVKSEKKERLVLEGKCSRPKSFEPRADEAKTIGRDDESTQAGRTPTDSEDVRTEKPARVSTKKLKKLRKGLDVPDWIHDDEWVSKAAKKSDSDSETDDEEVMSFARHMLGVENAAMPRPKESDKTCDIYSGPDWVGDVHIPISEKVKLGRRRSRPDVPDEAELKPSKKKKKRKKMKQMRAVACSGFGQNQCASVTCSKSEPKLVSAKVSCSSPRQAIVGLECTGPFATTDTEEEKRRKKEEARTLTTEEIRAILGDDVPCGLSAHWVRRSARMPSRSVLNTPRFKQLIEKLRTNDPDMVVLKMKKYLSDPDCPQVCIDTVLDALEENTNCQSLYIQNFNEGMRDKQVLRLLEILKKPSCNIWCLNIGETYKVKTRTWKAFTRGLKETKITHMYASEHIISSELKDRIRNTIRDNRSKHSMHIDPENLDVIVKCTHCWWNPINAKVLRPHLHRKGYAYILNDGEAQGLRGTTSGASLS